MGGGVPAPNKEASTVARIIVEQVICRYGCPIAILTDKGKEVDGQLMAKVCPCLDIDKLHTTSYKASTNAAVERFHRTLNRMIGRVVDEHQRDWDTVLPYVMAAYRSWRHEVTQYKSELSVDGTGCLGPSLSIKKYKIRSKGVMWGSRDTILEFWDPLISRERLKLETSNLA